jgi:hypothetical protein
LACSGCGFAGPIPSFLTSMSNLQCKCWQLGLSNSKVGTASSCTHLLFPLIQI